MAEVEGDNTSLDCALEAEALRRAIFRRNPVALVGWSSKSAHSITQKMNDREKDSPKTYTFLWRIVARSMMYSLPPICSENELAGSRSKAASRDAVDAASNGNHFLKGSREREASGPAERSPMRGNQGATHDKHTCKRMAET